MNTVTGSCRNGRSQIVLFACPQFTVALAREDLILEPRGFALLDRVRAAPVEVQCRSVVI
jgi:hypothetical protein